LSNQKKIYPVARSLGYIILIPMTFLAGPIIGLVMGSWVDGRFNSDPWGKTVLSLLGFVASVKQVYELIKRANKSFNS
jgi:F0F1-type ATP synthase assembly protein I